MKTNDPEKVAVFDISEIVKRINEDKVMPMDVPVRSLCMIAKDFSRKYYIALIPKKVLDEISDASVRQVLRDALSDDNVIIKDYIKYLYHRDNELNTFDFAHHVYEEYKCPVDVIACDTYFCTRLRYTITSYFSSYFRNHLIIFLNPQLVVF